MSPAPRTRRRPALLAALTALTVALPVALTALLVVPAGRGEAAPARGAEPSTTLVTRFGVRDGTFAESLARDTDGTMYVSLTTWGTTNTGQVVAVRGSGEQHPFGPGLRLGASGLLTGVAVDGRDRVYVLRNDFGGRAPSALLQVSAHGTRVVATLPGSAFPNGLTVHRGRLYVSDSAGGAVYRVRSSARGQALRRPWLHSRLLTPASGQLFGVNGIAFWRQDLFLVNASRGSLLTARSGTGARPVVGLVTRLAALRTADGLATDDSGRLWVTVNGTARLGHRPHGQRLLRLGHDGRVQVEVDDARWMNYPTAVLPVRSRTHTTWLYVLDGAFTAGRADLRRVRSAEPGVPIRP